jgi:hypothetical protein
VGAQRAPLAVEAELVGDRAVAREALPIVDPVALAFTKGGELTLADRGIGLGEQLRRGGER